MGIDFNKIISALKRGEIVEEFYTLVQDVVHKETYNRKRDFLKYGLNSIQKENGNIPNDVLDDITHDFMTDWLFLKSSKGNLTNGSLFDVEDLAELMNNLRIGFNSFISKQNRDLDPEAARIAEKVKNILKEFKNLFEPKSDSGYNFPSRTSWKLKENANYNGEDKYVKVIFDKLKEVDGYVRFSSLVEELKQHFYVGIQFESLSVELNEDGDEIGTIIEDEDALNYFDYFEEEVHYEASIKIANELSDIQKEILKMKLSEHVTLKEIGSKLGIQIGKAHYQIKLLSEKMNEIFNKYGFTENDSEKTLNIIKNYLKK